MLKMCLMRLRRRLRKLHRNGEISIYLSLVFTLIISLLLTVVSAARGAALQVVYECAVESALFSVFGEYNKELLDRYDVFFIDLSYLSNSPDPKNLEIRLNNYFDENFHPENGTSFLFYSDLLDVTDTNVSLTEYELATDRFGEPFANQVVEYMSNLVGEKDVKDMLNLVSVWDSYDLNSDKFNEIAENTASLITSNDEDTWEQTEIKEAIVSRMFPSTSLAYLIGSEAHGKVSTESFNSMDSLLLREKQKGSGNMNEFDFHPAENVYFVEYIMSKLGSYLNEKEDTKLKYEAEYVLVGMGSDYSNFEWTIKAIFYIRALEDLIALNLATDKLEKVKEVSEAISALLEIPEPIITETILVIWAGLEGVTDVRSLVKGERVPLIKESSQINVSLDGILGFLGKLIGDGSDKTNDIPTSEGDIPNITLSYRDYVRIMLYFLPTQIKTYRTMDMIEQDLRISKKGNEYFRFDVCADKVKAVFSVETGFDFRYTSEKKYSYF